MVEYSVERPLSQEDFEEIKQLLQDKYGITEIGSSDRFVHKQFEVITMFGPIPVSFLNNKTLLVKSPDYNKKFPDVVSSIKQYFEQQQISSDLSY